MANAAGIEVRYIEPRHTSQTCSFCGHYEKGQRINQQTFICKNPDFTKGKGKQEKDGTYKGINADWNAGLRKRKFTETKTQPSKFLEATIRTYMLDCFLLQIEHETLL